MKDRDLIATSIYFRTKKQKKECEAKAKRRGQSLSAFAISAMKEATAPEE